MKLPPLTDAEKAKLERALTFLGLEAIVRDVVAGADERRARDRGEVVFRGYDEIESAINACPITYLPALVVTIVERCERDGVFVEGGLQKVVASAIRRART